MRQLELARLAHVGQGDIVSFEKGRRLPSADQAKRIALVLGYKVEALFEDGFREKKDNRGRPPKSYVPYVPPEPVMLPSGPQPVESHRIICPHCGASSYALSDIPGVEYKCRSCSRGFKVDDQGQSYVLDSRAGKVKMGHEISPEARARISAGQRRRHARERAEEGV